MKKDMMPIDVLTWSFGVFFLIIMVIAIGHITMPIKPKIIKPSGPGTCTVACCIDLIANDKFPAFIPPTELKLDAAIKKTRRGKK